VAGSLKATNGNYLIKIYLRMNVLSLIKDEHLLVIIQNPLSDTKLIEFQKKLIKKAKKEDIEGIIVDVRGLNVIDSFTSRVFQDLTDRLKSKGISVVFINIRSSVAYTIKRYGSAMKLPETAENLEEGLYLLKKTE